MQQDGEDRRHPGKTGHPFLLDALEHGCRIGERAFQHQRAPEAEDHQQLVEPIIEGQRQHVDDHIVLDVSQVFDDRGGGEDDVAVVAEHALGITGAARRVDQAGGVEIDVDALRGLGGKTLLDRIERKKARLPTGGLDRAAAAQHGERQ